MKETSSQGRTGYQKAQSCHKGEEQSIAGHQSTGHTVFRSESAAECQMGAKWFKGVPSSQESVE